jgi:hypothetical protein
MNQYHYRFVDKAETAEGSLLASDAAHAAILVLQAEGNSKDALPRWKRHAIREHDIEAVPREAEFVEVARLNCFSLDIRLHGSRKRKPVRITA